MCSNKKKGSFDRAISQCYYFAIACISNPFVKSARLLDFFFFFGWVIHYMRTKWLRRVGLESVKHTGDKPYSKCKIH